jgi:hypothetical protein
MVIAIAYKNLFELGTTTVTSENASFPAARIYDRDIGLLFKANSAPANFMITVDQGAAGAVDVNRLIVPVGHNLNGRACKLQRSTDNFAGSVIDVVSWTQGDAILIDKAFAQPATTRYWRLNITCAGVTPEMPEIFLTQSVTLAYNPESGYPDGTLYNVERSETASGLVRKIEQGSSKREYKFKYAILEGADKTALEAWAAHVGGLKNFYLSDLAGNWVWVEMMDKTMRFRRVSYGNFAVDLNLLEVLAG